MKTLHFNLLVVACLFIGSYVWSYVDLAQYRMITMGYRVGYSIGYCVGLLALSAFLTAFIKLFRDKEPFFRLFPKAAAFIGCFYFFLIKFVVS